MSDCERLRRRFGSPDRGHVQSHEDRRGRRIKDPQRCFILACRNMKTTGKSILLPVVLGLPAGRVD